MKRCDGATASGSALSKISASSGVPLSKRRLTDIYFVLFWLGFRCSIGTAQDEMANFINQPDFTVLISCPVCNGAESGREAVD